MPYFQSTYHSKLYRHFKEIEEGAYREIIRYYEENEEEIKQLEFEENFELLISYINSLFEVGAYHKHLLMVDLAIEASISRNIQVYKGEDIFQTLLFKKAASFYNITEFDKADYILRELIKINPYDMDVILFLKKCLRKKEPSWVNTTRAVSIFFFLLAALVICIEVLLIQPFYSMYTNLIETSRISIFLLGLFSLIGGNLLLRYRVEREVQSFVEETKNRLEKN